MMHSYGDTTSASSEKASSPLLFSVQKKGGLVVTTKHGGGRAIFPLVLFRASSRRRLAVPATEGKSDPDFVLVTKEGAYVSSPIVLMDTLLYNDPRSRGTEGVDQWLYIR